MDQEVKEAICAKKVAYKAWLANKSSLKLRLQYSEARKAAATKVKLSKERAWKEFGERLDGDFKTANKVFWQNIRRLLGKRSRAAFFMADSNGVTLKDQDVILNRWRDYFSDLLNPVDATPIQIHQMPNFFDPGKIDLKPKVFFISTLVLMHLKVESQMMK